MDRDVAFKGMKDAIEQWRTWGLLLITVGLLASGGSFLFDPTLDSGGFLAERVVNLHALSTKFMILFSGAAVSISGVICLAVSAIIRVLRAVAAIKDSAVGAT